MVAGLEGKTARQKQLGVVTIIYVEILQSREIKVGKHA